MEFDTYMERALRTWNKNITTNHRRMNALCGVMSEAGEIADVLKKHLFHESLSYQQAKNALFEECGDVLFYVFAIMHEYDLNPNAVAHGNNVKLQNRHGAKFQKTYKKVDMKGIVQRFVKESGGVIPNEETD